MWQSASPYPVGFLGFYRVRETLQSDWAVSAERFGCLDRTVTDFLVGEVLGEENIWGGLARRATIVLDGLSEIPVALMSVVTHNLILEEDTDGS